MLDVFQQVCILVIFCVIGYCLCKLRVAKADHATVLSVLLVYVFGPCVSFNSFSKNFTLDYIKEKYPLLIAGLALVIFLYFVTKPLAWKLTQKAYDRKVYHYSLIVSNIGYMGVALCDGLMGAAVLLDYMVFTLPFNIYIYSIGYASLTSRSAKKVELRRVLTSPSLIAYAIGAVIGIFGIRMPTVLQSVVTQGGACMAPASMLMAGMVISQYRIKVLLANKKAYLVSALRLLVIPALVSLLCKGVGLLLPLVGLNLSRELLDAVTTVAVLMTCLPCGLNTIVYPKLVGEDCTIGASTAMISVIASLATIPLCVNFLM